MNEKKILNFIKSLMNEKEVIKSLMAFHTSEMYQSKYKSIGISPELWF